MSKSQLRHLRPWLAPTIPPTAPAGNMGQQRRLRRHRRCGSCIFAGFLSAPSLSGICLASGREHGHGAPVDGIPCSEYDDVNTEYLPANAPEM